VWTPIPLLTWLFPCIGHMGIGDSAGVIHDFAGPYTVGEDEMAFGVPTRVLRLDPRKAASVPGSSAAAVWDAAVAEGDRVYRRRMHNLCCDNCHSHVARCLDVMAYDGRRGWNMVVLAAWMFACGRHVSVGRALLTWLPFLLIVALGLGLHFGVRGA
jgi:hypothetical protein